jgi:hypothetical protein
MLSGLPMSPAASQVSGENAESFCSSVSSRDPMVSLIIRIKMSRIYDMGRFCVRWVVEFIEPMELPLNDQNR